MFGNLFAVASGGALGALMRYGVGITLAGRGGFPWATLSVNVIGSFLFGFLAIWLMERMPLAVELRAFVLIGVLGAFTTFSAFSWETLMLLQQGETLRAVTNMFASVLLCVLAAATGIWLARQIL